MRYLNSEDIMKAVTYDDVIEAVEEALLIYKSGNYDMPHRFSHMSGENTLLYMPCLSRDILGTKVLTIFPENKDEDKPVIDGLMLLNDHGTGAIKAMLDGKLLTELRTGAVGAMGVKYISSKDTKTLGLIGAGAQGIYQIIYACHLRPIEEVYITTRNLEKLEPYIELLKKKLPHVNFHGLKTSREVVERAELIITATSSMNSVLEEDESLYKNKTFVAIGSYKPDMRELADALIKTADHIYVDTLYAKEESGDLNIPIRENLLDEERVKTIADLVSDKSFMDNRENTIVYKSVGMALFDIVVAEKIYKRAIEKNIGQIIKL